MPKVSGAMEDYLEIILILEKKAGYARVSDIAEKLSVAKSSVHTALHILEDKELIIHEKYGTVKLTESGLKKASEVYERHVILHRFFEEFLGVESEIAENDACACEHVLSEDSFKAMKKIVIEMKR